MKICNAKIGDTVFLACGKKDELERILSIARQKIAKDLNLIDENKFAFAGSLITRCLSIMKLIKR